MEKSDNTVEEQLIRFREVLIKPCSDKGLWNLIEHSDKGRIRDMYIEEMNLRKDERPHDFI